MQRQWEQGTCVQVLESTFPFHQGGWAPCVSERHEKNDFFQKDWRENTLWKPEDQRTPITRTEIKSEWLEIEWQGLIHKGTGPRESPIISRKLKAGESQEGRVASWEPQQNQEACCPGTVTFASSYLLLVSTFFNGIVTFKRPFSWQVTQTPQK